MQTVNDVQEGDLIRGVFGHHCFVGIARYHPYAVGCEYIQIIEGSWPFDHVFVECQDILIRRYDILMGLGLK